MIVRVFPRRTSATPDDAGAVVGYPGIFDDDIDEARISVTFTYDLPFARDLASDLLDRSPLSRHGSPSGPAS